MQIEDIKTQTWNISDRLKINKTRSTCLEAVEQECSINILRSGYSDPSRQEIIVDCSNQLFIPELSKSEMFTVKNVLISENSGFILAVSGVLSNDGLTIRKKRAVFSEEQKKERSDRLKQIMQRKKEQSNNI